MTRSWERVADLALRYQRGDKAAFAELLELVRPAVSVWLRPWYIRSYSGADRSDLWQEARIALWQAVEKWDPTRSHIAPWLRWCLHRRMASYITTQTRMCRSAKVVSIEALEQGEKSRARERGKPKVLSSLADPGPTPEANALDFAAVREIAATLDRVLSPMERRVLAAWCVTYREGHGEQTAVARILGYDVKAVDNALARARRKLRRVLAREVA